MFVRVSVSYQCGSLQFPTGTDNSYTVVLLLVGGAKLRVTLLLFTPGPLCSIQ